MAGGSTALVDQEGLGPWPRVAPVSGGVALARLVGESLGPFAVVVTNASPPAIETALAMGLAVDDTVELPSGYVPGEVDHHGQWRWPHPYRGYAELIGRGVG